MSLTPAQEARYALDWDLGPDASRARPAPSTTGSGRSARAAPRSTSRLLPARRDPPAAGDRQTIIPHLVKWSPGPAVRDVLRGRSGGAARRHHHARQHEPRQHRVPLPDRDYVPDSVYSHCNTTMAVNAWGLKAIIFGAALVAVAAFIGIARRAEDSARS